MITATINTALVYSGPGAGTRSINTALQSLRHALPTLQISTITPEQLLEGSWTRSCRLLVMPGGADLPYCRQLNGRGTAIITDFVRNQGGSYLGLCAGAYFACSRVEFEVGHPTLQVVGDRELCFFDGIATGSLYPGFDYQSERGAVAAPLKLLSNSNNGTEELKDYINGGPVFRLAPSGPPLSSSSLHTYKNDVTILATFSDFKDEPAAALACHVGLGKAVLCATHPELSATWLSFPPGAGRSDAVVLTSDSDTDTSSDHDHHRQDTEEEEEDLLQHHHHHHVTRIKKELEESSAGRWSLWIALLQAAGLEEYLTTSSSSAATATQCKCNQGGGGGAPVALS